MINNHSNTLLCNVQIGCNILPNKAALNSYQILEKGMLYIFLFCLSPILKKKIMQFLLYGNSTYYCFLMH